MSWDSCLFKASLNGSQQRLSDGVLGVEADMRRYAYEKDEATFKTLYQPHDTIAIKAEIEEGKLNRLFDQYSSRLPPEAIKFILLCALAMRLGARIRETDLARAARYLCLGHANSYFGRQMVARLCRAMTEYRNDDTPYDFNNEETMESMRFTARSRNPTIKAAESSGS